MTADPSIRAHRPGQPAVGLVVELGRSIGSSAVAAGIALARARQLDGGGWVLLAELDSRGGDLLERLGLGRVPRARVTDSLPPGAAQLAEQLVNLEFAGGLSSAPASTAQPVLTDHLVEIAGVPGVRVLLGDHLVDGAARVAALVTAQLPALARSARATTVVIDGGAWTSAEPERLAVADVVYAVIQASSASQVARCRAELSALVRFLAEGTREAGLVAVVTDPVHDPAELHQLFAAIARHDAPARVLVLHSRADRRTLGRLGTGQWRGLPGRGLQRFALLAQPLGQRSALTPVMTPDGQASAPAPSAGYHPDVSTTAAPAPPVAGRPAPGAHEAGRGRSAGPDPGFWPFADGAVLDGAGRWTDPGLPWAEAHAAEDRPARNSERGWMDGPSLAVSAARQAPLIASVPPEPPDGSGGEGDARRFKS